ncbi:hypothetical protein G9A89_011220 [Geosiphon pyriformis]|nr:hypothetical protein G9A89_011220 [Geosiphon pyriformis]
MDQMLEIPSKSIINIKIDQEENKNHNEENETNFSYTTSDPLNVPSKPISLPKLTTLPINVSTPTTFNSQGNDPNCSITISTFSPTLQENMTSITPPRPVIQRQSSSSLSMDEILPKYSMAAKDMPPKYTKSWMMEMDPFLFLEPIQPQLPWPITKKLYIYGFLFWPLWVLGAVWITSRHQEKKRWCK